MESSKVPFSTLYRSNNLVVSRHHDNRISGHWYNHSLKIRVHSINHFALGIGVLKSSILFCQFVSYPKIYIFCPWWYYLLFQFLTKNGIYDFWNWFDDRTWYCIQKHVYLNCRNSMFYWCGVEFMFALFIGRYPLGRVIGGTVYPGLTLTAGSIWWYVCETCSKELHCCQSLNQVIKHLFFFIAGCWITWTFLCQWRPSVYSQLQSFQLMHLGLRTFSRR